jgi:hypothetical protein
VAGSAAWGTGLLERREAVMVVSRRRIKDDWNTAVEHIAACLGLSRNCTIQ